MQSDWAIYFILQQWVPYLGLALHYNGKGRRNGRRANESEGGKEGHSEEQL